MHQLSSITLPNSITIIDSCAFAGCTSLSSITIPDSVTSIGEGAFTYCTSLSSITIPDSVTTIGEDAFHKCTSLSSITLPNSITIIDHGAFSHCTSLSSITIPNRVTVITEGVFSGCTSLSSISIPDSVTTIDWYAFSNCTALNVVHYGGTEAQRAEIYIDSNNSYLENAQWHYECDGTNCPALPPAEKSGTCGDNLTWILDDEGILTISGTGAMDDYYDIPSVPWYSQREAIKSVVVEDGVTNIGDYAFCGCTSLSSITIPDSVTIISGEAFRNCTSLSSITIPDSVTSIGESAFYKCTSLSSITIPDSVTTIGDSAFTCCTSLSSITIPNTVTIIGYWMFCDCTSLTSITIPDSVTSIGEGAFYNCTSLSSITIPDSVTSIGDSAFYNCTALSVVHYGGTEAQRAEISIRSNNSYLENAQWHYECDGTNCPALPPVEKSGTCGDNLTWILDDEGILTISGTGAMYDYGYESNDIPSDRTAPWYSYRESIRSVVLEDGATTIGDHAFFRCSNLDSIIIPNSVTSIGVSAFARCTSLTSISIPDSITSIDTSTFADCTSLTSISIPNSVTSIGVSAFARCTSLTSISIPNSVTNIGVSAFTYCTGLSSITIPTSVTIIRQGVFRGCISLTDIIIPDSVNIIEGYAFSDCFGLSSITIPTSVTSIGRNAFYIYGTLNVVHYGGTEEEKAAISIADGNSDLENAQWHYECDGTNCPALPPMDSPFVDIAEGAYYFDPVLWAVEKGITSGLDATHFGPNATCTRAQVVTFLWRASGCPQPQNTDNPFSDVNSGDFFYTAVLWAAEKGITAGTGNGTFDPHAECTRGQVATFLWRAQGKPASGGSNSFTDVAPGAYYYDAVLWAVENGITTGLDATHFGPNAACSRGQIVTFLYRTMK